MSLHATLTGNENSAEERNWYDLVGQFRDKAIAFRNDYLHLLDQQSFVNQHPDLKTEYDRIRQQGLTVQQKIGEITRTLDQVVSWFDETFSGIDKGLGELGLAWLPVVPVFIIIGSITLMANWTFDYVRFNKKISEIQRLESQGVPPGEATQLVNQMDSSSRINTIITSLTPFLLMGGALLFFRRK